MLPHRYHDKTNLQCLYGISKYSKFWLSNLLEITSIIPWILLCSWLLSSEMSTLSFGKSAQLNTRKYSCMYRRPGLCGSSLDFEFIRECTEINKICPKFHFLTNTEIKWLTLCFCFAIYCLLASRAIWKPFYRSTFKILSCTNNN